MNREEKVAVVGALRERFAKASVTLVATNNGLSVEEANDLRRNLKAVGGELKVAKHTLTRLALADTAYTDISQFLAGPRGLVFGYADPVAVAKALVDFAAAHSKLAVEGGALEGQAIAAKQVEELAKIPDLGVLRARVACQVKGPGAHVAAQIVGPATRIAGAVAALVKKLETGAAA